MIPAEELAAAAEALASCRWARLGDCTLVSRQVHGHGPPGDAVVGVYLGSDAGRNLYGLDAPGQVVHADVLHRPGVVEGRRLRARLREAARAFLRAHRLPADETHRLLRGVEARVDTRGELGDATAAARAASVTAPAPAGGRSGRTAANGPSGHVHLAFRLGQVPLEFVPLAVEAAERAVLDSGLALLCLEAVEPSWETTRRPPCACGTGGGAPPAGDGAALREHGGPTVPALTGPGPGVAATGLARALGADGARALAAGGPAAPWADALRRPGVVAAAGGPGRPALRAAGRPVLHAALARRQPGPPPGGAAPARTRRGARRDRPGRDARRLVPRGAGTLHAVGSVTAAALRGGAPVHVDPGDLRDAPPSPRRPPDAILALDRSPSMRGRLAAAWHLADALLRQGHAVGVLPLAVDGEHEAAVPAAAPARLAPTRDRRALCAALAPLLASTAGGGTALDRGLEALAAALQARPVGRRTVCFLITDGLATVASGGREPFAAALAAMRRLRALPRVRVVVCGLGRLPPARPGPGTGSRSAPAAARLTPGPHALPPAGRRALVHRPPGLSGRPANRYAGGRSWRPPAARR